jgi:hypothetical protein
MRLLATTVLLFSLLTTSLVAVSNSPKKGQKSKSNKWKIERTEYGRLKGSAKGGLAVVRFYRKGDERKVQFSVVEVTNGDYKLFLARDGEKLQIGHVSYPGKPRFEVTSENPHFADIYGGYWKSFLMVYEQPEPVAPPSPPPATTQPQPAPSLTPSQPPDEPLDF